MAKLARDSKLHVRIGSGDRYACAERALIDGVSVSEWVRRAIMAAVKAAEDAEHAERLAEQAAARAANAL